MSLAPYLRTPHAHSSPGQRTARLCTAHLDPRHHHHCPLSTTVTMPTSQAACGPHLHRAPPGDEAVGAAVHSPVAGAALVLPAPLPAERMGLPHLAGLLHAGVDSRRLRKEHAGARVQCVMRWMDGNPGEGRLLYVACAAAFGHRMQLHRHCTVTSAPYDSSQSTLTSHMGLVPHVTTNPHVPLVHLLRHNTSPALTSHMACLACLPVCRSASAPRFSCPQQTRCSCSSSWPPTACTPGTQMLLSTSGGLPAPLLLAAVLMIPQRRMCQYGSTTKLSVWLWL